MDIEYFPDSFTILIHGHEPQVVDHLRLQIATLANGSIQKFAVHQLPGFQSVDGCRLFAISGTQDEGISKIGDLTSFECCLRPSTWLHVEELLVPFTDGSYFGNSHQYLYEGKGRLIISGGRGW